MIKKTGLFTCLFFFFYFAVAQNKIADSLKRELQLHQEKDTFLVKRLYGLSNSLIYDNIDSAICYSKKSIEFSKELNWKMGLIHGARQLSNLFEFDNKYDSSTYYLLDALKNSEEMGNDMVTAYINADLGDNYRMMGNGSLAEYHNRKYLAMARDLKNQKMILDAMVRLALSYQDAGIKDSVNKFSEKALQLAISLHSNDQMARMLELKADVQFEQKDFKSALNSYREILSVWKTFNNFRAIAWIQTKLSTTFSELNNKDSAAFYANAALEISQKNDLKKEIFDAYNALFTYSIKFQVHRNNAYFNL